MGRRRIISKRGDDGEVADSVDEEAPAFAIERDDHAGERGADEARNIDDGRVERDRVAEVALVIDHFDQKGLAAGHVEGIDQPLKHAEGEDVAQR